MDEETFEIAKENDLSLYEAEELQAFANDIGLDSDEAFGLWENL